MPNELSLNSATASNLTDRVEDVIPDTLVTNGASGSEETTYINTNWAKQWGYFNNLPELKSAMLMKAIWVCGKGYTCDPETQVILDHISGLGKDTFDDILFNMEIVKRVGGDAFAEIMRDKDSGVIINLKPLDPSSIRIVVDKKGIIDRYEQINKTDKTKEIKFKPEEILHLSNNRLADQISGISDITSMEKTILAEYQTFDDINKVAHRQAKPMIMFKLGTDDQTKIDAFIAKMDAATNKGENIYIPDDVNSVSYEVIQVNINQTLMEWRRDIQNKFYRAMGLPLIIFGQAGSTESGGKIEYLAHEQIFEKDQRQLEKQIWNQLYLKIDLIPPVSLLENLQTDQSKDGAMAQMNMQQSDMTAGSGR